MVAHYKLMADFKIPVPAIDNAAYQTMETDVLALRDAVYMADVAKEKNTSRFQV